MIWWVSSAHAVTVTFPEGEATVDLREAKAKVAVTFPIELGGDDRITGCLVDGQPVAFPRRELRCAGRVVPGTEVELDEASCDVVVTIPVSGLVSGDCLLMLAVRSGTSLVRPPSLVVHVPSPTIEVKTSPLRVERWEMWFPTPAVQLPVTESSGVAGFAGLRADWVPGTTESGWTTSGKIACDMPQSTGDSPDGPVWVPPHGIRQVTCALSGFELGKVTGFLRFTGPSVVAPVDVPVEVTTILNPVFVPVAIGVGLWCSFRLRNRLEPQISRSEARSRAIATLRRAADMRLKARDPALVEKLGAVMETLRVAIDEAATAVGVTAADTEAHAAVTEAIDDSTARLARLEARSRELTQSIDVDWRLPTATLNTHERARAAVRVLAAQVRAGNSREGESARSQAEDLIGALADQLRDQIRGFAALAAGGPPLVAAVGVALQGAAAEPLDPEADPVRIPKATHAVYVPLEQDLPGAIEATRKALRGALTAGGPLVGMDELAAKLKPEVPRDVTLALRVLEEVVGPGAREVSEKLLAAAGPDPALRARVEEALDAGRYADGVELVRPREEGGTPEVAVTFTKPTATLAHAVLPTSTAPVAMAPPSANWIAEASREAAQQTSRLRAAYYLVVSVGILAIATANALPTWVGTFEDFVRLFGWALGLDLGSKVLFELAARTSNPNP